MKLRKVAVRKQQKKQKRQVEQAARIALLLNKKK